MGVPGNISASAAHRLAELARNAMMTRFTFSLYLSFLSSFFSFFSSLPLSLSSSFTSLSTFLPLKF